MEIKKNTIINDSDLEQVKVGSAVSIFYFIEIGDEFRARRFYKNEIYALTDSEKKKIRRAFYNKFGYQID